MAYEYLICEVRDGVAAVTVNRPDKLNALNALLIGELDACLGALGEEPAVRAVILTGAGPKAFVAGADIAELVGLGAAAAERLARRGQALMDRIENLGKPVIAAVNGFALGGGLELAMACSFRYAADTARLGLPETGLGLIPGYGGTQRLPRLVGRGRALELILTGDLVDAATALALGLVDKVVPAAELPDAVRAAAAKMTARSPLALRAALQAVGDGLSLPQDGGCRLEAALFGVCGASADAREGCRAFLEKRKPEFRGE
jgi:enoyl-CoA hydratase